MISRRSIALAVLLCPAALAHAEVSLPRIFGDHMVLQRDRTVPVWGSAAPGESITVRFAGQSGRTKANAAGKWTVRLTPLKASADAQTLTVVGENSIELRDVLVGEVWLCAGQSNMEYAVDFGTAGAPPATKSDPALAAEIAGAGFPQIRLFRVEKKLEPPEVVSAGWQACSGEALAKFSAVGYHFARPLQQQLGVPVGLVQAAWGGSRIEVWTPPEGYAGLPAFAPETARAPLTIDGVEPGRYFAAMVRPLAPFAIRGVLWYQGESNVIAANDGLRYADKMEALVQGWRTIFARPELPFLSVQLAPFLYSNRLKDPVPHSPQALPELWEAQAAALRIPDTGLVPTIDLGGEVKNIHPGHKREIGQRLAKLALAKVYRGEAVSYPGSMFDRLEAKGSQLIAHFKHVSGSLKSRNEGALTEFEIAGTEGDYAPAVATVLKNAVVLSSAAVPSPRAVRFAWREDAQPNLVDEEGTPAYPFRAGATQSPVILNGVKDH